MNEIADDKPSWEKTLCNTAGIKIQDHCLVKMFLFRILTTVILGNCAELEVSTIWFSFFFFISKSEPYPKMKNFLLSREPSYMKADYIDLVLSSVISSGKQINNC